MSRCATASSRRRPSMCFVSTGTTWPVARGGFTASFRAGLMGTGHAAGRGSSGTSSRLGEDEMGVTGSDQMLKGLMQDDFPLTLQYIRRRMVTCSPQAEVVSLTAPESVQRATYGELSGRIDRLAHALRKIGVQQGDR